MPKTFEKTVGDLKMGLRFFSGKQAITGPAGERITAKDTRKLAGSVRLDDDLKSKYPTANRWDYAVAYNSGNESSLYYIEIHPACATSEAKKVVAKKEWLDGWLANDGKNLKKFTSKVRYCWVATDRVSPLDSPARKLIAVKGIQGPLTKLEIKEL